MWPVISPASSATFRSGIANLAEVTASGPIRAVGVAYAVSEIDAAPDEPHDERLDFILTEREWIDARGHG